MKRKNFIISFINIIIFLLKLRQILSEDCPYDRPLLYKAQCYDQCSEYRFQNGCKANNSFVITQWLNNIIPASDDDYYNPDIVLMTNGDLLIGSNKKNVLNRQFYGIKKNGRPYFKDKINNNEFYYYTLPCEKNKYESFKFAIKINDIEDKNEYIINIAKDNSYNLELYDFENNYTYQLSPQTFFQSHQVYNARASVINNISYSDNSYFFLSMNGFFYKQTESPLFFLVKMSFQSKDIINHNPVLNITKTESSRTRISSCFETDNKFIVCFYQDASQHYTIRVYDHNLQDKAHEENIADGFSNEFNFYKSVHFHGEAGAFGYFYNTGTENHFYIQFKYYNNSLNTILPYFTNSNNLIKIDKGGNLNQTINFNDMIKISDSKICFISFHSNKTRLYVVLIYNYFEENIKIRYYTQDIHSFYIYNSVTEIEVTLYNSFIAMAIAFKYDYANSKVYLLLFSYPNSEDFNVDITENLKTFSNMLIDPVEHMHIDNNYFGYIYHGFKIINYSEGYKLENFGTGIDVGETLPEGAQLKLVIAKKINFPINGKIEYAMVVKEPYYDTLDQYSYIVDTAYCKGGEYDESFFYDNSNYYEGRTSYINIIIDSEEITDVCENDINCLICLNNLEKICIRCKYSYKIVNEEKICLSENGESPNIMSTQPLTTLPPTTEPLTTFLPTTQPFTTLPLTTEPLTTFPPTTQPLTTLPPTTEPLTTFPPTIEPSTILPPTTQPLSTFLPTIESSTILLPTTEPLEKIDGKNPDTTLIYKLINEKTTQLENLNNSCSDEKVINNKCNDGKMSVQQINEIKKNLLNQNYTKNKTNTIIKTQNVVIQLSTLEDQQNSDNSDVSNIDFGECEEILKKANDIPTSESLIIYKTDIKTEDLSSTYVIYEVYNPFNLEKLNLSVCNDVEISIDVPITLNNDMDAIFDTLGNSGYNIFNKNDSFYQDICTTYTTVNGTDMLLSDRQKDIYTESQNLSICQTGCILLAYNKTSKKAKCNCSVEEESSSDLTDLNVDTLFTKEVIEENLFKTLKNSNFLVLKCYKKLFTLQILKNYGEILMSSIFLVFLFLTIVFCITGPKTISSFIKSILRNKMNNMNNKRRKLNNTKKRNIKKMSKKKEMRTTNLRKLKNPPKMKIKNNNNNKNVKNSKKQPIIANLNQPGKFFQSNIFLNVNVIKKKKLGKMMKKNISLKIVKKFSFKKNQKARLIYIKENQ